MPSSLPHLCTRRARLDRRGQGWSRKIVDETLGPPHGGVEVATKITGTPPDPQLARQITRRAAVKLVGPRRAIRRRTPGVGVAARQQNLREGCGPRPHPIGKEIPMALLEQRDAAIYYEDHGAGFLLRLVVRTRPSSGGLEPRSIRWRLRRRRSPRGYGPGEMRAGRPGRWTPRIHGASVTSSGSSITSLLASSMSSAAVSAAPMCWH